MASSVSRLSADRTAIALNALGELFGDRLSVNPNVIRQHSRGESWHTPVSPDAVAFPLSTEEVSACVKICAESGMPITPFGAGTSLEGHVLPVEGGLSLDLSRMKRIVALHPEDLDITVEAGLTHVELNQQLRSGGLFFPVDPGAEATLGGMAATRASGTNAVGYGTMRENILAMTVVLGDGSVIKTSRRSRKSSAGYDLTRLFIGSEGTLGIITEVTLRLYGIPEAIAAAVCSFHSLEGAVRTAIETIQSGCRVARIELLDDLQVKVVNAYSKLGLPEQNLLLLEFHGSAAGVREQAEKVQEIASSNGGENFLWRVKQEERTELWKARHHVAYSCKAYCPGKEIRSTDVCVPISRLADCILETKADLATTSLVAPIVGHVGDGNFHLTMMVDPHDPRDIEESGRIADRLVHRALEMDGTCTGEHGVGTGKRHYLPIEHGEGVSVMRLIKRALDPNYILNPGKVLPDEPGTIG